MNAQMAGSRMQKFRADEGYLARKTKRRFTKEVAVLLVIAIFFYLPWSGSLPAWLKLGTLIVFFLYIIIGLAMYPHAKSVSHKFSISLKKDSLEYTNQESRREIPYRDLVISKVIKRGSVVDQINLKTVFGQYIKLQGLQNMNELYDLIRKKLEK